MSSRPASPPPIARWPFFTGAIFTALIAGYVLLFSARPFPVSALVVGVVCAGLGTILAVTPFLIESDARLRLAEAAARDTVDVQLRRLAQTADQLAHAVSRSQSTEEQAGQALGTLEEVAERLVAQAEELAGALARTAEREQTSHNDEIQRLTEERDQKLTALEIRLNATTLALTETQAAVKKASATTTRSVEALATRLDTLSDQIREALAARTVQEIPTETPPTSTSPATEAASAPPVSHAFEAEHPTIEISPAPIETLATEPLADSNADAEPAPTIPSTTTTEVETSPSPARPPRKPRQPQVEHHDVASEPGEAPQPQPVAPLELALEGMPEPRPVMKLHRREPPGSTSLVATAYIGIGNKLYLRGDGPGLSWETGVPMQFLAIGKWGWTTTEATAPVTCRVYRNDDTPMLEENAVIDPGTKTEITPRF